MFLVLAGYEIKEFGIKLLMPHNYKMNSHVGNFCDNCQMSFETKDLLSLHSCANIKEEISELDATISDDPLSIHGSQNEIRVHERTNPLSEASEMINEGNIELTKAIDMVRQYNLNLQEGKNLYNKNSFVHEQKQQLNQSAEMMDAKENESPSHTEIIKVQPQKFKKMQLICM